jgi:hypothetical protein
MAVPWWRLLMAGRLPRMRVRFCWGRRTGQIGLVERFAACFRDRRRSDLIEHDVKTLVMQRVFGISLGYEDLIDHDHLCATTR